MDKKNEFNMMLQQVNVARRSEISDIISSTLDGVEKLESEIDQIIVVDHNDLNSMQKAGEVRKKIKFARIDTVKILNSKRDAVKAEKADYDLQDKLYLRAIQVIEDSAKMLESKAEFKEKTRELYFLNLGNQRSLEIKKFDAYFLTDLGKLGEMQEADYQALLLGKKAFYEAEIKRIAEEAERIRLEEQEKIEAQRIEAELRRAEVEELRKAATEARLKAEAEAKANEEAQNRLKQIQKELEGTVNRTNTQTKEVNDGLPSLDTDEEVKFGYIYAKDFDRSMTHFDFVFTKIIGADAQVQGGLQDAIGEVLVSVIRRGAFCFKKNIGLSSKYISEKLDIPEDATEWVAHMLSRLK